MTSPALVLAAGGHAGAPILVDLLVIFATAALVAGVFRRIRLETVPGYLVAGAVIGPHALGLVSSPETVEQVGSLAIILLMFSIGLLLDTSSVRRGSIAILLVGAASTLAFVLAAWPVGIAAKVGAPVALAAAMALSMSSTAVLLRILQQRRELRQIHGRITVGIGIAQDLLSVLCLALLPPLAMWAGAPSRSEPDTTSPLWVRLVSGGAMTFGGIIAMLMAGRLLLPRALAWISGGRRRAGDGASAELVLVLSAAIGIGYALVTGALGLSPEMGAFVAGLALSLTPFRHQLAGQLAPIRELLMAVFFTTIGLSLDPGVLVRHAAEIALVVVVLILFKTLAIGGAAWAFGAPAPVAVLTGVYLANAGEFSLVILTSAAASGMLPEEAKGVLIAIVVLSLIVSPMLVGPAHRIAPRACRIPLAPWVRASVMREAQSTPAAGTGGPESLHVVIAGFGPVGRHLSDSLRALGISPTIVDLNPQTVWRQARLGRPIIYGDITNAEVLESAGVSHADAFILTVPDDHAIERACRMIRRANSGAFIAARCGFPSQAMQAMAAGADHVAVEELATAILMEREVLQRLRDRFPVLRPSAPPEPPAEPPPTATR